MIKIKIYPNKTYSIDEIPGRIFKDGAELLTKLPCKIINISLSSKFPFVCQTVKVKSLQKKDEQIETKNYRPALPLSILPKIIEIVVHNQPISHLGKHNIFFEYQSGFQNKYSTITCFTHLTNQLLKGFQSTTSTGMDLIRLKRNI